MFTVEYYFAKYKNPSQELINNCKAFLSKVNGLLAELEQVQNIKIDYIATSTIRTAEHNKSINGATKSYHLLARAIDIKDTNGVISASIMKHQYLLSKYKLCLEHPDSTKGWCHLDDGARKGVEYRVFKP